MVNQLTYIYYLHKGNNIPFYVGKTIRKDNSRLNAHKNSLKENIYLEIIDEIPTKEWEFWERYYISLFRSWGFGLINKNNGGGGCITHNVSKEARDKISKYHKGKSKPFSKEHKINHKKSYNNRKVTWGDNISRGLKGRKITWEQGNVGKPSTNILQYDLEGNFIKEWSSIKEAELHYNPGMSNNIGACCRNKQKQLMDSNGSINKELILNILNRALGFSKKTSKGNYSFRCPNGCSPLKK